MAVTVELKFEYEYNEDDFDTDDLGREPTDEDYADMASEALWEWLTDGNSAEPGLNATVIREE